MNRTTSRWAWSAAVGCATLALAGAAARAEPLSDQWASAWSARQLDQVMALYAPHPAFMPTVGPRWDGRDEIRKNFSGVLSAYDPKITLHSLASARSGRLGYDSGAYEETITPKKGGAPIVSKGDYLFVFERQKNGQWKILEQTWTSFTQPPSL